MTIIYKKGDMFRLAPKDAILTHACNAQGQWGAGIANQFATRYPMAYTKCKMFCAKYDKSRDVVGRGMAFSDTIEGETKVGCLFTSHWYGRNTDPADMILEATRKSIKELLLRCPPDSMIYSPKINSGLFRVPWEQTAQIINEELELYNKSKLEEYPGEFEWIVCNL